MFLALCLNSFAHFSQLWSIFSVCPRFGEQLARQNNGWTSNSPLKLFRLVICSRIWPLSPLVRLPYVESRLSIPVTALLHLNTSVRGSDCQFIRGLEQRQSDTFGHQFAFQTLLFVVGWVRSARTSFVHISHAWKVSYRLLSALALHFETLRGTKARPARISKSFSVRFRRWTRFWHSCFVAL